MMTAADENPYTCRLPFLHLSPFVPWKRRLGVRLPPLLQGATDPLAGLRREPDVRVVCHLLGMRPRRPAEIAEVSTKGRAELAHGQVNTKLRPLPQAKLVV